MGTLRARTIYSDQRFTVTAVESVALRTDTLRRGRFLTASLAPVAVIVREPGRTYALDLAGQPVDIDRLDLPPDTDRE